MTVAIPLKSQKEYTELKFALRSIDKFVQPSEVLIIGEELPYWIDNITWIRLGDVKGRRQLSVKRKILAALEYSDEIIFSNDDIYWLTKQDIPYYWNDDLKKYTYTGSKDLQDELKSMGKPTKSFEVHLPIVFRSDFKEIIKKFSPDTLIRSAYANYLGIEGEKVSFRIKGQSGLDCKFVKDPKPDDVACAIGSMPFISTGVHSVKTVIPFLEKTFPNKSRFEI